MPESPFGQLVQQLFDAKREVDRDLDKLKEAATKIEERNDPRARFNRWRNTKEGKEWKQKQYKKQRECCAICREYIKLKNSHIDHIKPICEYPDLSVSSTNLRLTCQSCNLTRTSAK